MWDRSVFCGPYVWLLKTPVAGDYHVVLVEIKTEATSVGYSRVSTNMENAQII